MFCNRYNKAKTESENFVFLMIRVITKYTGRYKR